MIRDTTLVDEECSRDLAHDEILGAIIACMKEVFMNKIDTYMQILS